MAKLDFVQTFIQVVRAGGFAAAARQMGMPRSTVSLHISAIETSLGVRLLKRSTRTITLTDEGRQLFDDTSKAFDTVSKALSDVESHSDVLSGSIHLTAPADFPTSGLASAVTTFRKLHPDVRVQITLTNTTLDLVKENVDIAIRIEGGRDMDAVQRKLLDFEWHFCASAAWLERNGIPQTIENITDFISPKPNLKNYLERMILDRKKLPEPTIEVENNYLAKDLILHNFGVGLLPKGLCKDELASGKVMAFLDHEIIRPTSLTLTFPTRADMVPRIRIFADHICKEFNSLR